MASHSLVEAGGEFTGLHDVIESESARRGQPFPVWVAEVSPTDWARLGGEYLSRTGEGRKRCRVFTDKNALNWMYVGAAAAMLPGARFINTRREPLENCFGCFRQLFARGNQFSYSLEDIVVYWRMYDRLSRHWHALYPERFFEHSLELLRAEPEKQTRRLLEICGLKFEPQCLSSNQAQRAVYTASAAQVRAPLDGKSYDTYAMQYGSHLDGLRQMLNTN